MYRIALMIAMTLASYVKAESPTALISTQPITKQSLAHTVTGFGVIDVSPEGIYNINFLRPGYIVQIHVTPGSNVVKGQPLVDYRINPIEMLSYYQDLAAVDLAEKELMRVTQLVTLKLATQSQQAIAQKNLLDAKAKASVNEQLGGKDVKGTQTAPFDGIVVGLNGSPGDQVPAGTTILQLANPHQTRAVISLTPNTASLLQTGMPVTLKSIYGSTQDSDSHVTNVPGRVNPDTLLIDVTTSVPSSAGSFFIPGAYVQAVFTIAEENAWTVPEEAVLTDERGSYIFQVVDEKAVRINVEVGIADRKAVHINGQFDVSKPVVVMGNYELDEGMRVRLK